MHYTYDWGRGMISNYSSDIFSFLSRTLLTRPVEVHQSSKVNTEVTKSPRIKTRYEELVKNGHFLTRDITFNNHHNHLKPIAISYCQRKEVTTLVSSHLVFPKISFQYPPLPRLVGA